MRVHVLNTGTELLLGDVMNTHLAFIAREIFPLGLRLARQVTVPDGDEIRQALATAFEDADIIFVTGGLGPTTDDVTREAAAELLGLPLHHDAEVMEAIRSRIRAHRFTMTERIPRQADVIEGAVVFPNHNGTAPGMYVKAGASRRGRSPHLFLLPGPPRELEPMFRESVIPAVRLLIPPSGLESRSYRIAGMGESLVERAVGEELLALDGVEVGYCATPGDVTVRLIGDGVAVNSADAVMRNRLADSIYSTDGAALENVLIQLLSDRSETVVTAESCTGGYLAHRLTNVPGASAAFFGGFVTYANEVKRAALDVPLALIEEHGAVSEAVAVRMAEGALVRSGSHHAIATTGIAGPSGGSADKPVGTVYIALAHRDSIATARKFVFRSDRTTFKHIVAQTAFNLLRRRLLGLSD